LFAHLVSSKLVEMAFRFHFLLELSRFQFQSPQVLYRCLLFQFLSFQSQMVLRYPPPVVWFQYLRVSFLYPLHHL